MSALLPVVSLVESPPQLYCPDCGHVLGLTHDTRVAAKLGFWKYTHFAIKDDTSPCQNAGRDFTLPAVRHNLTAA